MSGWFYSLGQGNRVGPIEEAELKNLAASNRISLSTLVCHYEKTGNQWVAAEQIPGLKKLLTLEPPRSVRMVAEPIRGEVLPPPVARSSQAIPAVASSPFVDSYPQPVSVFIQSAPQPNKQLSAGGWFARSFSSTAGIVAALAVFFIGIPLVLFLVAFMGCLTWAVNQQNQPLVTPSVSPGPHNNLPITTPPVKNGIVPKQDDTTPSELPLFVITSANFSYSEDDVLSRPTIQLSVTNNTKQAISRAYFKGRLTSPGRSIPWVEDAFNYEVPGGVEPGESVSWELTPNMFGAWSKAPRDRTDLQFFVTVTGLDDANGNPIK